MYRLSFPLNFSQRTILIIAPLLCLHFILDFVGHKNYLGASILDHVQRPLLDYTLVLMHTGRLVEQQMCIRIQLSRSKNRSQDANSHPCWIEEKIYRILLLFSLCLFPVKVTKWQRQKVNRSIHEVRRMRSVFPWDLEGIRVICEELLLYAILSISALLSIYSNYKN